MKSKRHRLLSSLSSARGAVFLLFFAFCLSSSASAQLTARKLLEPYVADFGPQYAEVQRAVESLQRGDLQGARRLLHDAKKKNPQLAPAEVMLARLYLAAGRLSAAEEALELAVAQDRDDPEAFITLAELAFRKKQFTLAELSLERADKLLANYKRNKRRLEHLRVRLAAGQTSVAELRGLWTDAEKHLNSWIKLSPRNAPARGRLGRVLFEQKKYQNAREAFVRQAELDKNVLPADVILGQLWEKAGMREKAQENMEAAVKRHADNLRTRLAVADWALGAGRNDMAKENANAARKVDPRSTVALILAGRAARQAGDSSEAETVLQFAVVESPTNFAATNHLALTLASSDDQDKKRRGYEYAQLNFRAYSDKNTAAGRAAAITYAWLLFDVGREAEAETLVQGALRGGSISNESAFYSASILSRRGKENLAAQILKPVLALDLAFPARNEAQKLLDKLSGQ